jgi:hypothetical protein
MSVALRAPLLVLLALLVLCCFSSHASPFVRPVAASSLLASSKGFTLTRPLLLEGLDVGATLIELLGRIRGLEQTNIALQSNLTAAEARLQQQVVNLADGLANQGTTLADHTTLLAGLGQFQADTSNKLDVQGNTLAEHTELLDAITAVNSSNLAGTVAAMQVTQNSLLNQLSTQRSALKGNSSALLALTARVTAAESSLSDARSLTPSSSLLVSTVYDLAGRMAAAEGLSFTPTPLTIAVLQARNDVAQLQQLARFSISNDSALAARVTTAEGTITQLTTLTGPSTLVASVKQAQSDVTLLQAQTKLAFANDSALAARLSAAETLVPGSTLTNTVLATRDFTPTAYAGYTTLNGLKSLTGGTALTDAVNDHETRLLAAENLNGVATTLTNTVKQVRDLTTGTPLFTAVDGLRTLTAGTTLTNTVIGLRDMTAAGGSLVTAVKQSQFDVTLLFAQTQQSFANDSALSARLLAAESLTVGSSPLVTRFLAAEVDIDDLEGMVTGSSTLITAVKQVQQDVTMLQSQTKQAYANDTALAARMASAEATLATLYCCT